MKVKLSHTLENEVLNQVVDIMGAERRPSVSNTIESLLVEAIKAREKKKKKVK